MLESMLALSDVQELERLAIDGVDVVVIGARDLRSSISIIDGQQHLLSRTNFDTWFPIFIMGRSLCLGIVSSLLPRLLL